jgi:nucleoside-diphosphate-sugar epimerase
MKILIIGGTRFIGLEVTKQLVKDGHEVTLFHRSTEHPGLTVNVSHIYGNRNEIENFKSGIKKLSPDVVLDMIPITEAHSEKLVNAVRGSTPRIVTVSSCDVYKAYGKLIGIEEGEPEPLPISEDSPVRSKIYPYRDKDPEGPLKDYDKILVEKVIMNDAEIKGTVCRLPMVYGPNDYQYRFYSYLRRMDDGRPYILLDENTAAWKCNRGFSEDIAHGIALAVTDDKASGRIYNIAEEDAMTEADFVRKIAKYTGWNGEVLITPPEKQEGFNTEQSLVTDTTRIRKELGYKEITREGEAYNKTIEWERNNPPKHLPPEMFDYKKEDERVEALNSNP